MALASLDCQLPFLPGIEQEHVKAGARQNSSQAEVSTGASESGMLSDSFCLGQFKFYVLGQSDSLQPQGSCWHGPSTFLCTGEKYWMNRVFSLPC